MFFKLALANILIIKKAPQKRGLEEVEISNSKIAVFEVLQLEDAG